MYTSHHVLVSFKTYLYQKWTIFNLSSQDMIFYWNLRYEKTERLSMTWYYLWIFSMPSKTTKNTE